MQDDSAKALPGVEFARDNHIPISLSSEGGMKWGSRYELYWWWSHIVDLNHNGLHYIPSPYLDFGAQTWEELRWCSRPLPTSPIENYNSSVKPKSRAGRICTLALSMQFRRGKGQRKQRLYINIGLLPFLPSKLLLERVQRFVLQPSSLSGNVLCPLLGTINSEVSENH